jgi:cytidine deaminase
MRDSFMRVDQALFDAAVEQLHARRPGTRSGVAAAVYLSNGSILTGVPLDNINPAMTLCAETGPMCQANTEGEEITASICVADEPGGRGLHVLAPCGACQERLAVWGPEVEVGVAADSGAGWESKTLIEVHPHYWAAVYAEESEWPSRTQHSE